MGSLTSSVDAPLGDARALRSAFPHLHGRIYLDTAAAGLCWQGHGAAVARFYDEVKSRGFDARPQWLAQTQALRARLAAWLSVEPADVVFVSNTTEGLNLAAHSLRLPPGSRVLMAADEFPSLVGAWSRARPAGVELVPVPIGDEAAREAALLDALLGAPPDTRHSSQDGQPGSGLCVLAVSQTHWSTGTTLDLPRLGRACREHGALLMVDGMQALGAVPTDLSLVDIYAASFFKWMLSGFGIGVLVTSTRARALMDAAFRGYGNLDDPGQLQYAHVNIPAVYGLDATLDFFERIGWPLVHRRVQWLGGHLVDGARRLGLPLVTPPTARAGIFSLRCADADGLRERLAARGISVSARGDGIRISPHYYNEPEEIDACLAALAETAGGR
ncbi:MAG: aminotransferase class V-fold PLP-dependent enzyme [Proteobacteria bacterium]|nr:aminotransferase class V-fold PLP-dependent enzyme [Pseudomonadota bacterium]